MSLINFFDNRRYWGGKRNKFLSKIYFYPAVNRIVTALANIILPIYFKLTRGNKNYIIKPTMKKEGLYIVSLTSFHIRIPKLWLVVESILRNKVKPDKLILYLQAESLKDIPTSLIEMEKRGVDIILCDSSLRSHNKYIHTMKEYPNSYIITIDDDIFYRDDFVGTIIENSKKHPNTIICNWAKIINNSSTKYREWAEPTHPEVNKALLPIGCAGVLYPPNTLHKEVFNTKAIKDLCLTADDIWLAAMHLLKGTKKYYTGYKQGHLAVFIKNNLTLLDVNRERNQVCVDNLNNYYKEKLGIRPFIDLIDA